MKRFSCVLLILAILLSLCAFAEQEITVGHVQAVSVGDDSNAPAESEGEDAEAYLREQGEVSAVPDAVLDFEEGFTITLPGDWVYYDLTQEMADKGVVYAMSDHSGTRQLFIQFWATDCANIEGLNTLITNTSTPPVSNIHEFNGIPFVVYDLPDENVSCAAALIGGKVMNLVFTPQSDSEYMLTAAGIMQSFKMTEKPAPQEETAEDTAEEIAEESAE